MTALNFTAGPAPAPQAVRAWSPMQADIFNFIRSGVGNAVIIAVAGSGKSTTIVEGMNCIPDGASAVFLAFNKAIAEELKAKGVNARTFHSLTYSVVTRARNTRNVDGDKLQRICKQELNGNDDFVYGAFICRLVGIGRQIGVGCLVPDLPGVWYDIIDYHDLELENEEGNLGRAVELASQLLDLSNASAIVDFDDLLYLPVKDGLALQKFDYVFVDEAQDTNAIQRALLLKLMYPHSRLIAVGDPAQSIYGFRGATSNALQILSDQFNCTTLPLSVSYRCATSIVEYARQWVDHIQAAPGAPEGEVVNLGENYKLDQFSPDDLIVCRTTRPLVTLAFRMYRAGIPCRILGKDIAATLRVLVQKMKAPDIDTMMARLEAWKVREVEKAMAKMKSAKVDNVYDKFDTIAFLVDGLTEDNRTVAALLDIMGRLFEGTRGVTLCTGHKSKGLEAARVWWLNRSQCPGKWVRQEWQMEQELNLCYVIATRAKTSLVIIEEPQRGNGYSAG